MSIEIRLVGPEQTDAFVLPIRTAFGIPSSSERTERTRRLPELVTRITAFDGSEAVGSAGAFAFDFTTPGGGTVPTSGLTMVAVMPTHRRQGILRKLIQRQLADARERGQPIAALWATEATIYGRFGYGLASFAGDVSIERDRSAFVGSPVPFQARFVSEAEALERFPPIYERARRAALVVDLEGLAQHLACRFAHGTQGDVARTARRPRHDEGDRLAGIGLSARRRQVKRHSDTGSDHRAQATLNNTATTHSHFVSLRLKSLGNLYDGSL